MKKPFDEVRQILVKYSLLQFNYVGKRSPHKGAMITMYYNKWPFLPQPMGLCTGIAAVMSNTLLHNGNTLLVFDSFLRRQYFMKQTQDRLQIKIELY